MKTITLKQNGDAMAALFVGEADPRAPAQQQTVPHASPLNNKWARGVQISGEFIFVKRYGCPTVGMSVDDFVALCVAAEPLLSWPPAFAKHPEVADAPAFSVEIAPGELSAALQWQHAELPYGSEWGDVTGATGGNFTANAAGVYRCVATSGAGVTVSRQVIFEPPQVGNGEGNAG